MLYDGCMKKLVVIAILIVGLSGCQNNRSKRYERISAEYFDTVTAFIAYCSSEAEFTKEYAFFAERMKYYHQLFDIYNQYSGVVNLAYLNEKASTGSIEISDDLKDFLVFGKTAYYRSNGKVNIGLGAVLQLWHSYRESGNQNPTLAQLPSMNSLSEANQHTDIENLVITENSVYYSDSEFSLDVGALAKGYAVEMVAKELVAKGYDNFLISAGGNVKASGQRGDGQDWVVGVQNPQIVSEGYVILKLAIADLAVVTSGDYQRFYQVEGVNYGHIIDPATLLPPRHYHSVTVVSKSSQEAEFLSTYLFILPIDEALAYVNNQMDIEACFVLEDYSLVMSEGFNAYIIK